MSDPETQLTFGVPEDVSGASASVSDDPRVLIHVTCICMYPLFSPDIDGNKLIFTKEHNSNFMCALISCGIFNLQNSDQLSRYFWAVEGGGDWKQRYFEKTIC